MATNHTHSRARPDWGTLIAGLIALTALATAVLLAISLAPASAETPAERCKRETTAYNNAWKNSWAASHPGKKPSDAPKPPVPYKCGSNNDGPPPTVQPTTSTPDASKESSAPTVASPRPESGPTMNAPTTHREIEHPAPDQATIGNPTPSTKEHRRQTAGAPTPRIPGSLPNTALGEILKPKKVACSIYNRDDCKWLGNDPVNALQACESSRFYKDEDLIVRFPEDVALSCGNWMHIYRDHFQSGEVPIKDREDFLTCVSRGILYGSAWDGAKPPNHGYIWMNPRTGTIVQISVSPQNNIVSAWTVGDGKDWGGCAA